MPRFDNEDTQVMNVPNSSFTFSVVKPEKLEASEYTLVTILVDISGSVTNFADDLLKMVKTAISACKKNSRAENILVRVGTFAEGLYEVHGFIPLNSINPDDYLSLRCGGGTALFDAAYSSIGATVAYSKSLVDQYYSVNSVVYIITDGRNTDSVKSPKDIKDLISDSIFSEIINGMVTILVGINATPSISYLKRFKDDAGLDYFIDAGQATEENLAKFAGFMSKSISSHSQSIGTSKGNSSNFQF